MYGPSTFSVSGENGVSQSENPFFELQCNSRLRNSYDAKVMYHIDLWRDWLARRPQTALKASFRELFYVLLRDGTLLQIHKGPFSQRPYEWCPAEYSYFRPYCVRLLHRVLSRAARDYTVITS